MAVIGDLLHVANAVLFINVLPFGFFRSFPRLCPVWERCACDLYRLQDRRVQDSSTCFDLHRAVMCMGCALEIGSVCEHQQCVTLFSFSFDGVPQHGSHHMLS